MSTKKKREKREAKKKKKSMMRNIAIIAVAAVTISAIIAYNYSVEQTKQKGLIFGANLEAIQEEIKDIQTEFYSEKTKWEEGDQSRDQLLEFYNEHINRFEDAIDKYDELQPPELFESSVELLKISSQTQLQSDAEYIKWIKNDDDDAAKARSDALLQDSLEYELMGLVEFYSAKTGTKLYDDTDEKFTKPKMDTTQRVNQVVEHMTAECDKKFGTDDALQDGSSNVISGVPSPEWTACMAQAEEWRQAHLP